MNLTSACGSRVVWTCLILYTALVNAASLDCPCLCPQLGQGRALRHTVQKKGSESRASKRDLVKMWEKHMDTEFVEKSADAAVATMTPNASVIHVPVMTGGVGTEPVRQFYATHFIPKMPNVTLVPIDRSVGIDTIVDEFIFEFTHDVEMDWMLPGVKPTGKHVRVPFVAVIKFEGDKLRAERIYWDQASVLVQLGLLSDVGLPVYGAVQADKLLEVAGVGKTFKSDI